MKMRGIVEHLLLQCHLVVYSQLQNTRSSESGVNVNCPQKQFIVRGRQLYPTKNMIVDSRQVSFCCGTEDNLFMKRMPTTFPLP
jgi:hypothetical protein